jgi:hypothetical protein
MRRLSDSVVIAVLDAWARVGRVRSLYAVSCLYVALLILGALVRNPSESPITAAVLGSFIVYCFARPRGLTLFGIAALPGCVTFFVTELLGAPPWVGIALVPVALWLAWDEDKQHQPPARRHVRLQM